MNSILQRVADAGLNLAATVGLEGKTLGALIGVDMNELESALAVFNQPSLCYVPIMSESLTMRRTSDIGTTMLITQTTQKKDYITDNAAPRPRVWTGQGYITSLVPMLENGIALKPSLVTQQAILEAAADSRQPVTFKTDTGEVVHVLVQDLQITSTPKSQGVKAVSYTVQEVKVLENVAGATSTLLDKLGDTKIGNAVINSIPGQTILNLGNGTLVGAGTAVGGAAALLTLGAFL